MSKVEIISELSRLSPEELAEIRARIDELTRTSIGAGAQPATVRARARIRTPRLANPSQAREFIKQVRDLSGHAKL